MKNADLIANEERDTMNETNKNEECVPRDSRKN